jgi:hypothetical protein
MHRGHTYPQLRLYRVHLKVIDSTGDPELSVVTIEFGEIEFGKTAELSWVKRSLIGEARLRVLSRGKLMVGIIVTELGRHVVGIWVELGRMNR